MDKIFIRGLEVDARHGVNPEEKVNFQPFSFDADLYFDLAAAGNSDDLSDTINYAKASKIIVKTAAENSFNLIEKLAYTCTYALMNALPVQKVRLTVYKPQAPMHLKFQTVGVTVEVQRTTALLSLGSSLGDKAGYLNAAIQKLNVHPQIEVQKVSSFITTPPYGGVAQHDFLNCAVQIQTLLSPQALLNEIHRIENECGRVRQRRWEDRTLDIDIVFFGKQVITQDNLVVPHPEYASRPFVLDPLKEIAPDFVCPVLKKAIKNM